MTTSKKRLGKDESALGRGIYTVPEAARLTRLRTQRVNEWFRGLHSQKKVFRPVFESDYEVLEAQYAISFLDLIELKIAGELREAGVSLQYLRKVYGHLQNQFGPHPLATRRIYVSCVKRRATIFTQGLDDRQSRRVIEAISNQGYFATVIFPFLKQIVYDDHTDQAIRWHIAKLVVLDPAIRFGKPIIEDLGILTRVLRDAYYANNKDASCVARWYGISERYVNAAVEFEDGLAA